MQQELIEMLEKVLNWYDYIGSDSYYAKDTGELVKEAEALIEKAKNNAPAVPQGVPEINYPALIEAAFPVQYSNEADGPTVMPSDGMSLRDYFAAKAMDQLIAGAVRGSIDFGNEHSVAKRAYEFSDAMLEARK